MRASGLSIKTPIAKQSHPLEPLGSSKSGHGLLDNTSSFSTMKSTQNKLRQLLLAQRQKLTSHFQHQASQQCVIQLQHWLNKHKNIQRIALYWPIGGEIDLRMLTISSQSYTYQLFLPILHPYQKRKLLFAPYSRKMTLNHFDIPEPLVDTPEAVLAPWELDCVCMPLVGFDNNSNRLGRGGGFYDASFAFKKDDKEGKPYLLGFAYSFQQVEQLPVNEWDVPCDKIFIAQCSKV